MHSQMTIGKKLFLCFGTMLMAALGLGYSSWYSIGKLGGLLETSASDAVGRRLQLCGDLNKALSDLGSLERGIAFRVAVNGGWPWK